MRILLQNGANIDEKDVRKFSFSFLLSHWNWDDHREGKKERGRERERVFSRKFCVLKEEMLCVCGYDENIHNHFCFVKMLSLLFHYLFF